MTQFLELSWLNGKLKNYDAPSPEVSARLSELSDVSYSGALAGTAFSSAESDYMKEAGSLALGLDLHLHEVGTNVPPVVVAGLNGESVVFHFEQRGDEWRIVSISTE